MRLHLAAWPEIEAYLERSTGIVIPIGSTEQHGPNGLLGTDALCPEIIAWEAEKPAPDLLIAPTFNVGMAQHHMAFPGSITLRPSTMIAAIGDWIDSLTRSGFTRLFFLNGHGGNVATIEAAFAEAYAEWSLSAESAPYACKLCNWWDLPGIARLCERMFPRGHGMHATPSEVSVTYWAYPEHQKQVNLAPEIAPSGPIRDAADYRARFPDGRIGSNPGLATPELGGEIVTAAKAALVDAARGFFAS
ncbi:MAG: creatininase family protein [Maricaulaceae bacterium]